MQLTSQALTDGEAIPLEFAEPSSGGENTIPDLAWSGAPDGTKSYALTVYDPDAPTGSGFWHWVAFDIPTSVTSIEKGGALEAPAREWENDYGYKGYGGAAPPAGRTHRYIHTVHALNVEKLEVPEGATQTQARFMLMAAQIDSASITPVFSQPKED
ncbi:YbhB/YbcL family Raf kinase inhibitor-like protein [Helcobacillus massiliensis]|uniref:YbhB/YbcL family Raf kinase inhibitor-like protein n=1 Tax=Helcobacillus massiliensis TaxID=521392 RepID=UPI0021A3E7AD|nr:YbhB/YbcL family Raf kinase inhibitor-like protein [Helcobacillus massiliensis]MCT1556994.1 YbhB/YbcL family Raf kinase inhibitor-like protein [Helcobacillus massiliensis]MCT2035383.1 YbhB/YbcL family Raf kinase inhibitor-like protein [Helcobacillus massiliensis]MCT2331402.1 YbhB/YbcL family Raf kinase inhibitor-like protein [Helcobacillus massiliensis]